MQALLVVWSIDRGLSKVKFLAHLVAPAAQQQIHMQARHDEATLTEKKLRMLFHGFEEAFSMLQLLLIGSSKL